MATDYETLYRETKRALGEPTREFVEFFNAYPTRRARVLDVGCGQGRDALFIARLGHQVVGIDSSPAGIADLLLDANRENLDIEGHVVEVRHFRSRRKFDVVVVDRTLHMLPEDERRQVLEKLLMRVCRGGHMLIADERRNIPEFEAVADRAPQEWTTVLKRRGFLFLSRA